ncbi:MAG: ERCC4 domain-containing protein [Candidatus Nanoarchaeia archaeon]
MFYNIFQKNKIKKQIKNIIKPKIIADIHEKNSLVISELYSNSEIELEKMHLEIGDYIIGDAIIERKTIPDFFSSLMSKRLIIQIENMLAYPKRILIIEGNINELEENKKIIMRGFILSIIEKYNTPTLFAKDYKETAKYLVSIAKREIKKPKESSFHKKTAKTSSEQKLFVLESFPFIGPKKADKLINKFKTLKIIFSASEKELYPILGKNAKKFMDLLSC